MLVEKMSPEDTPRKNIWPPATARVVHFPVTTRFWRGVRRPGEIYGLGRFLRRACDWRQVGAYDVSFPAPTCPDCAAYQAVLRKLGYLRYE